ncbi:uncharacterized protein AMSG_06254 [Thecamonas trahens ATCC 50062]|uniref:Uncharacterized protein n=1 Tax=Thecamonas trahens ATCC 50062 TaxID=461836 RepID=A0A0L0DCV7_THETB|nr:hypothetical protein AMSG_06254 [Thecamonas trahens ATCC 50062]KNC49946.1 hypothetical protein AMSG_06254 [Thecamonas trahens ATCC 50062]|eukprot:XP_013757423.1 hypothetical protein AMSG_06254 [Thecamonas trahens ATCC 50062]
MVLGAGGGGSGRAVFVTAATGVVSVVQDDALEASFAGTRSHAGVAAAEGSWSPGGTGGRMARHGLRPAAKLLREFDGVAGLNAELGAAYSLYCMGDVGGALGVASELDPRGGALDDALVVMSRALLDATPASDPRWAAATLGERGVSEAEAAAAGAGSAIVRRLLEAKARKHQSLLSLLSQLGWWEVLSVETRAKLQSHGELLASAQRLREVHQDMVEALGLEAGSLLSEVYLGAMHEVLAEAGVDLTAFAGSGLGTQDVFYARVSTVPRIVAHLAQQSSKVLGEASANGEAWAAAQFAIVGGVGALLGAAFLAGREYAASYGEVYGFGAGTPAAVQGLGAVPRWWSDDGELLNELAGHVTLALSLFRSLGVLVSPMGKLLIEVTGAALDVYLGLLGELVDAAVGKPELAAARAVALQDAAQELIGGLAESAPELAYELGQKYGAYTVLVGLALAADDADDRLTFLMDTYGSDGFADAAFQAFMASGRHASLLRLGEAYPAQLSHFLESRESLAWIHAFATGETAKAGALLSGAAGEERTSAARRKTLVSLAKLAHLADGAPLDSEAVASADNELYVIRAQELLPESAERVLTPRELVLAYISEEMGGDAQSRFVLALELIERAGGALAELEPLVWRAVVTADPWPELAQLRVESAVDDATLQEHLRSSMLYAVATSRELADVPSLDALGEVVGEIEGDEREAWTSGGVSILLGDVLRMVSEESNE